jgi:outer membrane protein
MKTLCLIITISLIGLSRSNAQTEKGRWTIGAQVGNFTYQKQESGYQNLSGNLTPLAGYFVANGLVMGTGIPFGISSTKYGDSYVNFYNLRQTGTSIGLSPFVRYYIGQAKLKPFVSIAYSYSRTASKYKTDTAGGSQSKTKGYTTALTPMVGAAYFVSRTLGLTLSLNYNQNHVEYNTVETSRYTPGASSADYTTRSLSLGIGFQLFVGGGN